jgi:RNA polymerase sigma-70 factor (ECF subfamily)
MENMDERRNMMMAIIGQYQSGLLRYATRLVRDETAAQDVVQEVFVKLFRSWDGQQKASPLMRGWLYRVTHNQAVDLIRKQSRYRTMLDQHAEECHLEKGHTSAENATSAERLQLVMAHVDRLSGVERQVLLLRLEEGLSYKEIAAVTDRSVGNVGKVLHHAVQKISNELKRTGVIQ